jgi:hypothetical protein
MKPQNVTDHDHFFVYIDNEGLSIDEYDHIRYDACLTKDDGAGIWSPHSGMWFPQPSYERACRVAHYMAEYYEQYHPLSKK